MNLVDSSGWLEYFALSSAKLSHELNLPMADSIILATARSFKAILWTQDLHFANFPDVEYISLGGIEVIQNSVAKILQKGNSRIKI
ncbi:MAG: hypothetical protein HY882_13795 [Deltaproteobacteria bacterium]|nr:hypothetical protein [Deltaproteobacteria bacterium]